MRGQSQIIKDKGSYSELILHLNGARIYSKTNDVRFVKLLGSISGLWNDGH